MLKKITLLFVFGFVLNAAFAQKEKVYAGFIYNFTKNMDWPANKKSGDFVITVVGKSPLTAYLNQLAATKTVGAQKIVVREVASVSAASGSHLIFLPSAQSSNINSAKSVAKSSNAVLITEKPGLGLKGAGLNFIENGDRIGFEINKSQLKACGIKMNAKLEALGIVVG